MSFLRRRYLSLWIAIGLACLALVACASSTPSGGAKRTSTTFTHIGFDTPRQQKLSAKA